MTSIANAADNLTGLILDSGWTVIKKIPKGDKSTGSFFSVCYQVKKDGEICFLKAFDFAKFFIISGGNLVDVMAEMTTAFQYERDLSLLCQANYVTKVSFVRDSGMQNVPGFTIPAVPYLIFDLADGDVRGRLSASKDLDLLWKLNSLHNISVGLRQLHSIGVAHQDLKPSNILVFKEESKIGDLGRSVSMNIDNPFKALSFSGDYSYAPPEILYGFVEPDIIKRTYLSDCYLLGSMVVFYFTGVSMSATLATALETKFIWGVWTGNFDGVKDYLLQAYEQVIIGFKEHLLTLTDSYIANELTDVVKSLCYPIPAMRGHKLSNPSNKFDLQRYISKFDLLHKRARLNFLANK